MPTARASWRRSRRSWRTGSAGRSKPEAAGAARGRRVEAAAPALPKNPRGHAIRRHVLYVPGFDPRDARAYWGLFRRESGLTAARRGLTIAVGEPTGTPDALTFPVRGEGPDGTAEVVYTVLRWDDVVRRHFPRPNGRRLLAAPVLWWRLVRCGHFAALRAAGRRFATVILGVHLIFAGLVALVGLATVGLLALVELEGWPMAAVLALAAALALALLTLAMAATRGKPFYVAHLVDDTAFTHRHAAGGVPAMAERLDAFAARIVAAARDADEVVVVGHSSGSFLGVEALARALDRAPNLGVDGARVVLMTLGSVLPWVTLDPAATGLRAALARVEAAPLAWIDVLATWDWLSVHGRDPLGVSELPSRPDRPVTLQVALANLVDAETRHRTRYNLFQRHFQLLMASRARASFDYLALVASPQPVALFVEGCRAAEDAALAHPAT